MAGEKVGNVQAMLKSLADSGVFFVVLESGTPSSGTLGFGAGLYGPGTLVFALAAGGGPGTAEIYRNEGTIVSPSWIAI